MSGGNKCLPNIHYTYIHYKYPVQLDYTNWTNFTTIFTCNCFGGVPEFERRSMAANANAANAVGIGVKVRQLLTGQHIITEV